MKSDKKRQVLGLKFGLSKKHTKFEKKYLPHGLYIYVRAEEPKSQKSIIDASRLLGT